MSTSRPRSCRARPLPPEERRAALVAATLRLIREHGVDVSTRQIATAAGIAEGTIFRVFPDKESLVRAAIDSALDPASVVAELERIDPATPLDAKLVDVVRITQRWLTSVISLMMVLHKERPSGEAHPRRGVSPSDAISPIVERLLEPDRKLLRIEPAEVAKLLRLLVFASSHPVIKNTHSITAEEIVAVLLDGVRDHVTTRPHHKKDDGAPC